ncbi:MAG TPA: hypothetical protein VH253_10940 [Phycisphaerae bacterium]|nr:hypothetical protein [Phycisphaerae bacterium]
MSKCPELKLGRDAAKALGLTARTLQSYVRRGCPHTPSPAGAMFDPADVRAWMEQSKLTGNPGRPAREESSELAAARLRKENALAAKYELAVAVERGELARIDDVKQDWLARITTTKHRLLGLPAAMAPTLEGLSAEAMAAMLRERITEALSPLDPGDDACGGGK